VDNSYFITEDNVGMLKLAKEAGTILVRAASHFRLTNQSTSATHSNQQWKN
jgi:hypothetical protein